MVYPEWKIDCQPDRLSYNRVLATLDEGSQVHRYPFHFLERIGAKLELLGLEGEEERARCCAYSYAKRRGWRIMGVIEYEVMASGQKVSYCLVLTRIE